MKSRLILNLVLVFVVSALILFVIYGPDKTGQLTYKQISDINLDEISRIEIQHNKKQKILIHKNDSGWIIQKPFTYRADEFRVLSLLSIAHQNSFTSFDVKENELDKYGLKKPAYTWILDNIRFSFGTTDPLNFRRYVKINNTVHLLEDEKYRFLAQDAVKFSSKILLPPQKTIVKLSTNDFSLYKNSQQHWVLSPDNKLISTDEKNRLIETWRQIQARDVSKIENITDPGLQTVIIEFKDKTQMTLYLVENKEQLFFIRNDLGLKIEISKSNANDLFVLRPDNHPDKKDPTTNTTDK